MNIPSLPTDNLYKFLAIFGLVLFTTSFFVKSLVQDETMEIMERAWENEVNYRTLGRKYERLALMENSSLRLLDSLKTERGESNIQKIKLLESELKDLDKDLSRIEDERFELLEQLKNISQKLDAIEPKLDRFAYISKSMRYVGIILVIIGFTLWYWLHQKYIDAERKWKGEIFVELLKEKKDREPEDYEPDTDTESDS